ncbi:MAG: DNA-directed RNA polymerase subunit beta [Candidatus Andersenbacteria bacterium CG10_big_fil_rev_8_21_14_0_10_54_11]|uniref:DNA-directed RNA polymerase subunit beta n=1 Tax=Candidatus Andersenbacteria bacterium CG10_big_fil_rev_8_21_14_0_10_54_11 TaxID=1974485 RepID=A0A2M6WZE3_9BACT|nr:MAG: DNA-directed RNA polymerase subunit beta [Candidatus Andersenbacteria bacterium CG10_big_fil_rev_8_21_14_0_10_54_11]
MSSPLRQRTTFTRQLPAVIDPPHLLHAKLASYSWFTEQGLDELFKEISPIVDYAGNLELQFLDHYLDTPKHTEETSRERNATYESAIRCAVRLINKKTGEVKEQEVYLGEFPVMTERATFIINGVERVVVSQLIRSPGVLFNVQAHRGRNWYGAKIIPNRGAWLELETGTDGALYVRIDRKRKVPVTSLLRAMGVAHDDDIMARFADCDAPVEAGESLTYLQATLAKDAAKNQSEGLKEVYKRLRPGDLATVDNARQMIDDMFFRFDRYDFGRVGRYRMNQRLNLTVPEDTEHRVFRIDDLIAVTREVIRLNVTQEPADDIDHLGNRRVRPIGELIQNKFRVGLMRMERIAKDRMSTLDLEKVTPSQLINARPIIAAVKEFFTSSQLSQFMDQTNPLSEVEHKRRLSAMGPGGLDRHRAGFEVRDVHRSHYGRICPIQSPEGPNIGLVGHMALYARLNEYGFLETPYRKVTNGRVTDEVVYLDAYQEEKFVIAQAGEELRDDGMFAQDRVEARRRGEFAEVGPHEVDYMDVATDQIVSIAAGMIPFIEHDDAQRALMGSNMQRQAVPSVVPRAPRVGTGLERRAAYDSGQVVLSDIDGTVTAVDGQHIVVTGKDGEKRTHRLQAFQRSNQSTAMTQHPVVAHGQSVAAGDLLADGSATELGELALGQNLLVAFIPWYGGNFEDAIVVSENVVRRDLFTSVHIEDFMVDVRDTKLGPEVITRDIPNVSEEKLRNLADDGIVRIGAEVKSGDILVGKVTNKGETDLTPEERLLRAIFGEKAKDVKDTSLYLAHGQMGKVIDVKVFSREEGDKLSSGVLQQVQVSVAQLRKLQVGDKLAGRHGNKGVISEVRPVQDMPYLTDGTPVDIVLNPMGVASRMNIGQILETHLGIAAERLDFYAASLPFAGIPEAEIRRQLIKAGLPADGKVQLYDGLSGDCFDHAVTVGVMYVLKLHHLVDDKIHMRSTGPYSLVTQQPLGGKAQFGGQRFGEMEVWALEAYGAAYSLQEMLTIKSDDVPGRSKTYESIVKGTSIQPPRVPAAFDVLVKELKGLALDVDLVGGTAPEADGGAAASATVPEAARGEAREVKIRS